MNPGSDCSPPQEGDTAPYTGQVPVGRALIMAGACMASGFDTRERLAERLLRLGEHLAGAAATPEDAALRRAWVSELSAALWQAFA